MAHGCHARQEPGQGYALRQWMRLFPGWLRCALMGAIPGATIHLKEAGPRAYIRILGMDMTQQVPCGLLSRALGTASGAARGTSAGHQAGRERHERDDHASTVWVEASAHGGTRAPMMRREGVPATPREPG
jgi:hypothetical protein